MQIAASRRRSSFRASGATRRQSVARSSAPDKRRQHCDHALIDVTWKRVLVGAGLAGARDEKMVETGERLDLHVWDFAKLCIPNS